MKIYSQFNDYYDTAIGYGFDPKIIYNRNTNTYEHTIGPNISNKDIENFRYIHSYACKAISPIKSLRIRKRIPNKFIDQNIPSDYFTNPKIIIFCGKNYNVIEYNKNHYYSLETLIDQIKKTATDKFIENTFDKKNNKDYFKSLTVTFKEFFNFSISPYLINSLHTFYQSPILLLEQKNRTTTETITVNPCLKNYQFYKVFDPFMTFQELAMFISNYFGAPNNEMVEISDEDRISMHGFDKHSFRSSKRS